MLDFNKLYRTCAALALIGGVVGFCWMFFQPPTYRYRVTVEVDTPQGLRSGSTVRAITYHRAWIKLPESAGATSTDKGQAVVIELPNGKTLFALRPLDSYDELQAAFGNDSPETLNAANADRQLKILRPIPGRIPSQSGYPRFVYFDGTRKPATISELDGEQSSSSFGEDYRVRRVTVVMTSDAVSTGIENKFPWLAKLQPVFNGQVSCVSFTSECLNL